MEMCHLIEASQIRRVNMDRLWDFFENQNHAKQGY